MRRPHAWPAPHVAPKRIALLAALLLLRGVVVNVTLSRRKFIARLKATRP